MNVDTIRLMTGISTIWDQLLQASLPAELRHQWSGSHLAILAALQNGRTLTMQNLARLIQKDKSTLSVLIRKLETHGFVQRSPDELDRRKCWILSTPKGNRLYRQYQKAEQRLTALCDSMQPIPKDQEAKLQSDLHLLEQRLLQVRSQLAAIKD